eukprot:gnl/Dysnectes_brevis/5608_a8162_432.p1 GENE.gnl/Dysnectes_brevis/5608_a8162_432~~gnl/Dysnectes_brevis/5608_a8162_432.p1  ORF type:complete len:532 (-),score=65.61 gnl/Dysnectes_brevis/5608_a8162_432:208-1740(-)
MDSFGHQDEHSRINDFEVLEQLGVGAFGVVYKVLHKETQEIYALKVIELDIAGKNQEIEDIRTEITLLSDLSIEQVVSYYGSFVYGTKLFIILEFMGGGSVDDVLQTMRSRRSSVPTPTASPSSSKDSSPLLSTDIISHILKYSLISLVHIHGQKKIHRDIKAANILLSSHGDVKLADFGVATQLTDTLSHVNTFVGSPYWMSPEVIQQAGYNSSADIWSLGITVIEMATGEPPLRHLHPMRALMAIPRRDPPQLPGHFDSDLRDFVSQCLQLNPKTRPSASQLLEHPLITKSKKHQKAGSERGREELEGIIDSRVPSLPMMSSDVPHVFSLSSGRADSFEWVFDTILESRMKTITNTASPPLITRGPDCESCGSGVMTQSTSAATLTALETSSRDPQSSRSESSAFSSPPDTLQSDTQRADGLGRPPRPHPDSSALLKQLGTAWAVTFMKAVQSNITQSELHDPLVLRRCGILPSLVSLADVDDSLPLPPAAHTDISALEAGLKGFGFL